MPWVAVLALCVAFFSLDLAGRLIKGAPAKRSKGLAALKRCVTYVASLIVD
jgi:hypothetical protein